MGLPSANKNQNKDNKESDRNQLNHCIIHVGI